MDLSTAQAHLQAWLDADLAVAAGRTVQINGRSLTLEDSVSIRNQIADWQRAVDNLKAAANGARPGVRIARWT